MADPHLYMFIAPFLAAVWWTKHWLMVRTPSRWRHLISGLASSLMWVYNAYAATRVLEGSGGITIAYGSTALSYLCVFMALVSVAGVMLGFVVWTEEEAEDAAGEMRDSMPAGGVNQ